MLLGVRVWTMQKCWNSNQPCGRYHLRPQPSTINHQPSTLNPQPSTLNPQPSTLNHQPLNHQPSTLNPQPFSLKPSGPSLFRRRNDRHFERGDCSAAHST